MMRRSPNNDVLYERQFEARGSIQVPRDMAEMTLWYAAQIGYPDGPYVVRDTFETERPQC